MTGRVLPVSGWGRVRDVLTSSWGARLTSYLVFLAGWELISMVAPRVPGPRPVLAFLVIELTGGPHGGLIRGQFLEHFLVTLQRFGVGLGFAFAGGVLVGVLIGTSGLARALFNDTLLVLLALPAIIWAFLTVMWFGLGPRAPIVTTALAALPFVAVNVAQGVRAITPELERMSWAFRVPLARRLRHLVIPAIAGYIFAGLRFGIIIGWNGVLLAEWFGAADGVGWRTRFWYDANRYRGFVGWVALFIIFIVLVDRILLVRVQRRVFRWRDRGTERRERAELLIGIE